MAVIIQRIQFAPQLAFKGRNNVHDVRVALHVHQVFYFH